MKWIAPSITVVAALGFGALGYSWRDLSQGQVPSARTLNTLLGVRTANNQTPEQQFRQNFNLIRTNYTRPVASSDLTYAGMQGLIASLGDPHSNFLPPKLATAFAEDTRGNFFGVGARLSPDPAGAKAANVFPDGPAFKAGLRPNDVIINVNGKKVGGMPIDQIVEQIKGPEGTTVTLTVLRPGANAPLSFTIRRARIITPTVESKFFAESGVGYLNVSQFSQQTPMQFDSEIEKLEKNNLKGLVIDMRGNPGGLLDSAQEMLSRFADNKPVVTMRLRGDQSETVRTFTGAVKEWTYPIVVLIDETSASAAEIFAGCLRDYGKATLVGTHTYGKASVQNVFPLVDRASAKITIAKYYLPGGEFIGRKVDPDGMYLDGGLKPNIVVELDENRNPVFGDPKTDNQLERAIEVVLGKS